MVSSRSVNEPLLKVIPNDHEIEKCVLFFRCYAQYSRGPCEPNQYLERENADNVTSSSLSSSSEVSASDIALAKCVDVERCDNGWIFWPSHHRCYQLYTQGPCHKGDLLIVNPLSAEPYCGCDPVLLEQYYFRPLQLCYEHFTRGPCESGLLFAYNHTSSSTACMCSPALDFYHVPSGRCFQFGTKGPCRKGQIFSLDKSTGQGVCSCKKGYILWPDNGQCYKAFTPGPCGQEQFIVPYSATVQYADGGSVVNLAEAGGVGVCVKNPCPKAHLYFPDPGSGADSVRCHKVGCRGPRGLGPLVLPQTYSANSHPVAHRSSTGPQPHSWHEGA